MTRWGLLADVHGNGRAFGAVLADLRRQDPVVGVAVLGDHVGYNAEPAEVVRRLREEAAADARRGVTWRIVAGNHDREVARDLDADDGTSSRARAVITWTRGALDDEARGWLRSLPGRRTCDGFEAVHGCFMNDEHTYGYVTGTMVEPNLEMLRDRADFAKVAAVGHTHQPMICWLANGKVEEQRLVGDADVEWPIDARAVIVNPGAVGQPRDKDPRAAYGVLDVTARRFSVRRVPYPVADAAAAITAAALPHQLAERLLVGR